MQNEKIIQAIAAYLNSKKVLRVRWDGKNGYFPAEWPIEPLVIASEIASAIAPHLPGFRDLQIGDKVEVIAKLNHGNDPGHFFEIGRIGKITSVDEEDEDLSYKVDNTYWVSRGEINPV